MSDTAQLLKEMQRVFTLKNTYYKRYEELDRLYKELLAELERIERPYGR